MTLQVLYQYSLPAHIPLKGSISYADLASACGLDESRLTRIIRFLILSHIFTEPFPGHVSHSSVSRLLATESQSMDFLGHITEDMFPADFYQARALRLAPHGTSPLDCGASLAFSNGQKSFFDILSADPERMKRFGGAMGFANASGSHTDVTTLLTGFDWCAIAAGSKVVDIGGSFGHTARHILRHAPNIGSLTVQDLPDVIEQASKEPLDTDLEDRMQFQAANFFDIQPVTDADIYICRGIFVDWPEEKALGIIRNLVPSMKIGSILVVNEPIIQNLTSHNTNLYATKITQLLDLQSKCLFLPRLLCVTSSWRPPASDLGANAADGNLVMVALNAYVKSVSDWERLADLGSTGKLKLVSSRGSVIVLQRQE